MTLCGESSTTADCDATAATAANTTQHPSVVTSNNHPQATISPPQSPSNSLGPNGSLSDEDDDHGSEDERAAFNLSPNPTPLPQQRAPAKSMQPNESLSDVGSQPLSSNTILPLSMITTWSRESSGTAVSSSPGARTTSPHDSDPATPAPPSKRVERTIPHRPESNTQRFGSKRKARASDISNASSPRRPKK
jgi:hypothetical protein